MVRLSQSAALPSVHVSQSLCVCVRLSQSTALPSVHVSQSLCVSRMRRHCIRCLYDGRMNEHAEAFSDSQNILMLIEVPSSSSEVSD